MAQFRSLLADDVREILVGFGLSRDAYVGHHPIAVGTINTNVRVETTSGPRFLRVNEGKTREDVEREASIVAHVSAGGVPTPVPFAAADGRRYLAWRGEVVSLFPWLPGRTLTRAEVTAEHARQVGGALAQLHHAGASHPDHRSGRYEPDEIDRRLALVAALPAAASDTSLAGAVATLSPELAALRRERAAGLPMGIIHGDLFIDNVLYDGPRLSALLDFEQASWGIWAYDLAVTLLAFTFGRDDFRPELVRALFDGYAALRPITAHERAGFAAELRFVSCRFAVTRITDVYLKRTAGAAPGKDFARYLQRLASVHRHLGAADGLLDPS